MTIALIIQARMGSKRLPGKSMLDLAGEPLVGRIIERVKRCEKVDKIILAIPDTKENHILYSLALDYQVNVFVGSETDLLSRYYHASLWAEATTIVRLPADNATPEPTEIDRIIHHHLNLEFPGFSSNLSQTGQSGYPDGIGAEVFNFDLLEHAFLNNTEQCQREHVHLNFYNYETGRLYDESRCKVSTVQCPPEFRRPDLVLDINTLEDYQFMKELYEYLYPKNPNFHITDTIDWYDNTYMAGKG